MIKKIFLSLIVLLFIIGCTQEPVQEKGPTMVTGAVVGSDVLEEDKGAEEEEEAIDEDTVAIRELLAEGKSVKSISYKYKGPETGANYYDFYVKGDKVRYIPDRGIKSMDEKNSYNAIYLDKAESTAEAYCDDRQCRYKGKKADLRFVEYDMLTPFDWLDKITTAKKVGEELLGARKTWKLEANDNIILWVDTFSYGVPLQIMHNDNKYEFTKMTFNSVKDSDVGVG